MEPADRPAETRPEHVPVTVYWQRRAVIGLVIVALVAGIWLAVSTSRSRAAASAEPAPTTSAQTASTPSASSAPAATASTPVPTPSPTAAAEATVNCDVAQLVLRVTGPAKVKAGTEANLVVTFTNVGSDPCQLPLNKDTFALVITSGSDEIWSTKGCASFGPDSTTALQPGQTLEWTTTWKRQRANKCTVVAGDLRPGTYVATASWRDGPSARLVMTLTW